MFEETIAALATAVGQAGIAIVRISGPKAIEAADQVFRGRVSVAEQVSHTIAFGHLVDNDGSHADEVLLVKMLAPKSYTREDVIEIHCHGGHTPALTALKLIFATGVRPAEPGEFTKRAFLNGRIDLVKAEAVMDLIQSHSELGAKAAVRQLEGRLSAQIRRMREGILDVLAQLEVNLDYPEYDVEELTADGIVPVLSVLETEIRQMLAQFQYGRILREGMEVVIAGKPNAGKSSLMNRLSGKSRSIVTDIPGTTRDIVEDFVSIRGIPVVLRDTAGLRETEDVVERIGVSRTLEAMEQAHLLMAVFDVSVPMEAADEQLFTAVMKSPEDVLIVLNKIDRPYEQTLSALRERFPNAVLVSAITEEGLSSLEEAIVRFAESGRGDATEVLLTNSRHEHLLRLALSALEQAGHEAAGHMTLDLVAFNLKVALEELGRITGEQADDDLAATIFSRFCIGK